MDQRGKTLRYLLIFFISIRFVFADVTDADNAKSSFNESSNYSVSTEIQLPGWLTHRDCPGYIKGDNNLDFAVDIIDIVLLVQCIMMDSCLPLLSDCEAWAMDFDDDGQLGVSDIAGMVYLILFNNA